MPTYNIYEAKTHFSQLVEEATHGKEVVIAKAGKPVLKLVPVQEKKTRRQEEVCAELPGGHLYRPGLRRTDERARA